MSTPHFLRAAFLAMAFAASSANAQEPAKRVDLYGDPLPAGAIARLGTVRFRLDADGHGLGTAFSPDGKVLAMTDTNRTIRLWDIVTGKLLREILKPGGTWPLLFTPDGKSLVVSSRKSISFYEVASGKLTRELPSVPRNRGHDVIAISPDGSVLASASDDDIYLLDIETGKQQHMLRGHKYVHTLLFVPGGRTLMSMGHDKRICRWDIATGKLKKSLDGKFPRWSTFRISPDGKTLAIAVQDGVLLFDTETGKQKIALQGECRAAGYGLAFSPDGRTLATDRREGKDPEATISFWDSETGKPLRRFHIPRHAGNHLEFTPDGKTLMTSGHSLMVFFWDAMTGRRLHHWDAHEGEISSLAFTSKSDRLISAGGDGVSRVWDVETARQVKVLGEKGSRTQSAAILSDGQTLISSGYEGFVRVQNMETGKELRRLRVEQLPKKHEDMMSSTAWFAIAPDEKSLAAVGMKGIEEVRPNVFGGVYEFCRWELATGRVLAKRPHGGNAVFSPDSKSLVRFASTLPSSQFKDLKVPDTSNTVYAALEDADTGRLRLAIPQPDHCSHRHAFSRDGRLLATATFELLSPGPGPQYGFQDIHVWELATGQEVIRIRCTDKGEWRYFEQLAFAPDGRSLVLAQGSNHMLRCFDLTSGRELWKRSGYQATVRSLAFSPDGKLLATGHADSTILLWDLAGEMKPTDIQANRERVEAWWTDLGDADAAKAYKAMWKIGDSPEHAIPLFWERLKPPSAIPADKLKQTIEDLDSANFKNREKASKQLAEWEEEAESAMQAALQKNPSAEQSRRLKAILDSPRIVRSPEKLRDIRAIQVLEHIATPDARQLLEKLAGGAAEARVTQEAKASLARLAKR